MRKSIFLLFLLDVFSLIAQTPADSEKFVAQPIPDRTVTYNLSDTGVYKPITWGLDLAWLSEENVRRGVNYMGKDRVDVIRSSYTPTSALVNGGLASAERQILNQRISIIRSYLNYSTTKVMLNCDHPSVDDYFLDQPEHWVQLIDTTAKLYQAKGCSIVSVAPFNEPDYGWGQASTAAKVKSNFYSIASLLQQNDYFKDVRICGGNTLNCDQALSWYNYLKAQLDEGNTHQLAGSFDNYAAFFMAVRANGHHATADELHNVMEAMVGVEYGMQTGIWWGTAELARGEFVKASDGRRLGYAEHRNNWTASSVYRNPEGKVQAFMGSSERQAVTTTYRFVSQDRDVYYDGHGPQREFVMEMPGGTGYKIGQSNAERVIAITYGEDIQPVMDGGTYTLLNRYSQKVMQVPSATSGASVSQGTNAYTTRQQWVVNPVSSRIGDDFSYYTIVSNSNQALSLDVLNWSLNANGDVIVYDSTFGSNQQWYLEYVEDGWFYIRNRFSTLCLEVAGTAASANVRQGKYDGGNDQQWRFIPITAAAECMAPSAPSSLTATAQSASVRLDWTASAESDVTGYYVYRSDTAGGSYSLIARDITTTAYIDNKVIPETTYYYVVKSIDESLNRSVASNEVSAATGKKSMTACFYFDGSTADSTDNAYYAAPYGVSYTTAKIGTKSLYFDASSYLQLPTHLVNSPELTLSAWVYCQYAISSDVHLFDFAADENNYMYLAPRATGGKCQFGIVCNGVEQSLSTTSLSTYKWTHVAVVIGDEGVSLYVNGELQANSSDISFRPDDIQPFLNYIARSEATSSLFKGRIDDFKVFNEALTAGEVAALATDPDAVDMMENADPLTLSPIPADRVLRLTYTGSEALSSVKIYNADGKLMDCRFVSADESVEWDVSGYPSGVYIIQLSNRKETLSRKWTVRH